MSTRPNGGRIGGLHGRPTTTTTMVVCAISMLAAGCGSSTHVAASTVSATQSQTTSATTSPTRTPDTVPDTLATAIKQRLTAQDGTLISASTSAEIQTAADVRAVSGGQEKSADRGLDAAGRQSLTARGGNAGVRVVFHFPDAATALADFRASTVPDGSAQMYSVPGVPNSSAADDTNGGTAGDRNVTFVIGSYEYRLGFSLDKGAVPTRADFIAMTQDWYSKLKRMD